jgi:hypothetical protein
MQPSLRSVTAYPDVAFPLDDKQRTSQQQAPVPPVMGVV